MNKLFIGTPTNQVSTGFMTQGRDNKIDFHQIFNFLVDSGVRYINSTKQATKIVGESYHTYIDTE